jgi:hypothetical protein
MLSKHDMKVKAIILCWLLLGCCHCLQAQSLEWFEGSLVRSDNQVQVGNISLTTEHDLIILKQGEQRTVLPAHKLKSLYFYDAGKDVNRRYVSLKINDGVRSVYQLYEVVISGEIDILRRKKESAFSLDQDALDFNYYIYHDHELLPLRKFKRRIYNTLQLKSDDRIQYFMKTQGLGVELPVHIIRIVEYYNGFFNTAGQFAKK